MFEMNFVVECEGVLVELICDEVVVGCLVILVNKMYFVKSFELMGIGIVLKCKINVNIGNLVVISNVDEELEKLYIVVYFGVDIVMDLLIGKDIDNICNVIIEKLFVLIGIVLIY